MANTPESPPAAKPKPAAKPAPRAKPGPRPAAPAKPEKAVGVPAYMRETDMTNAEVVGRVRTRSKAKTGRPDPVAITTMRSKVAFPMGGDVSSASAGSFYSAELSTDFLEKPQSTDEQRNFYRYFYRTDPFVGQAVDVHTDLPLSKTRITVPKCRDEELGRRAHRFCERWAERIGLLHRLTEIVHEYTLLGEVFVYPEDTSPDMPRTVTHTISRELDGEGNISEKEVEREDADNRAAAWMLKNYRGWTAIRVIPPEQVHMESFPFTDEKIFEVIPDSKTKDIVARAQSGDEQAIRIVDSMPQDVVEAVAEGRNIPLNTDPDAGSFVYYFARKKSQYEARGYSILERCMNSLVYRDKLRQAQTQIASRHMTPIRLVWGEDLSAPQVDMLRDQVDLALQDPDYSIVTNFEVHWEEMGADQRLLDLSGEYEVTDRQMYAGLGVTESLLSGESSYSGDRINLEVINTRYMLLREQLQDMVQNYLFRPMCRRMGFIEVDEDGNEEVVVPGLSFTRLALRDNSDTFDSLFNLYQKGSIDIDVILELLNIDPHTTSQKLKRDVFTLNDSSFNEVLRGVYGELGRMLAANSDAVMKVAETLGVKYTPPKEEGESRF